MNAMQTLWAEHALLHSGWANDVRVTIDARGYIDHVQTGVPGDGAQRVGILLPAPVNGHSHGFQRAMAGLTERRGPDPRDSFWTWRKLMFRFLDRLTPEHVEAIAALVQMEMLEAGYATNVEFHYLHHQPGGMPYANPAEMSERIAAATVTSGIGLTLLPVHYQFGGLDRRPLGPGQIRFGTDPDGFARLYENASRALRDLPSDCNSGVAPHSLRAVAPDVLDRIAALTDGPMHMHLAEQQAEVDEVSACLGRRPVEWVLDNIALGPRVSFIHCTRMQPHETVALAQTGVVAGLCPITESSLGDGIFDAVRWFDAGGHVAIGSDSNIRIALAEELRTLEYSQRLRDRSRAALATETASTGRRLFEAAARGGALAAGRESGAIRVGLLADLMALDAGHIDLAGRRGDTCLDSYVFAGDDRMVLDVWSAGRHMVRHGRHVRRAAILAAYRAAMHDLGQTL